MFRRGWRRADLVNAGAVGTFVVIVAVLGISLLSLVLGLVVALLVPVVVNRYTGGVTTGPSELAATPT